MKIVFTKLCVVVMLVFGASSVSAQNFDIGNSAIQKSGHPNDATVDLHIDVTNISGTSVNVNVSREPIDVGNTSNNFCWGDYCYPPTVSDSPNSVAMAKDETNSTFKGQLYSFGVEGTYTVRYCFKVEGGLGGDLCFNAKYIVSRSVGIEESEFLVEKVSVGNVAPNPITGGIAIFPVTMHHANNPRIEILNALGQIVKIAAVNENADAVAVDVSDMGVGVYFYQLVTDNAKSVAKKMVVR